MDSFELDESKQQAIQALFDESQVILYALAHGIPPSLVRRRLLAHIAGAPPSSPIIPPATNPPHSLPSPLSLTHPSHSSNTHQYSSSSSSQHRGNHDLTPTPIVAQIRHPRR